MSKTLQSLFLGALIAAAGVTHAQETTENAPATGGATDLSGGVAVSEDGTAVPQVGQPYIAEQSGDWGLRCLKAAEGQADPCQLYQLLQDNDGNNVAEIMMFPLPPGGDFAAGATVMVPLGTLLTEDLILSVDGGGPRRYPFTFCNEAGCISRIGFSQEEVNLFKRGNSANLRMVPAAAPDQEVNLSVSLSGFTAGYDNTLVDGQ